ncbi:hypothetical protein O9929_24925 [Vibrio lentus]|nr:hypothetical protein [Vibrio lentus]
MMDIQHTCVTFDVGTDAIWLRSTFRTELLKSNQSFLKKLEMVGVTVKKRSLTFLMVLNFYSPNLGEYDDQF